MILEVHDDASDFTISLRRPENKQVTRMVTRIIRT